MVQNRISHPIAFPTESGENLTGMAARSLEGTAERSDVGMNRKPKDTGLSRSFYPDTCWEICGSTLNLQANRKSLMPS